MGSAPGWIAPVADAALVDAARRVRCVSGEMGLFGVIAIPLSEESMLGEDDGDSGILNGSIEGGKNIVPEWCGVVCGMILLNGELVVKSRPAAVVVVAERVLIGEPY